MARPAFLLNTAGDFVYAEKKNDAPVLTAREMLVNPAANMAPTRHPAKTAG
jgi:hypothetical protein